MVNNHLPKNNQCVKNWEIASGKDCAVLPGVVTTAARGNPFPMPLAIVTKSKMHQGMNKSNAQKQTNRQTHRKCSWGTVPVQVTCRQTLYTKTICIILKINFCATVLNIFSNEIISHNTNLMSKTNFWSSFETLESTWIDELMMMKFYLCLHNFSELWNIFSQDPKNCLWHYYREIFTALTFRKYTKYFNMLLNIILVQDFCALKTEISLFPIGFHLKHV